MLKSMTGYGRAHRELHGYDVTVEVKSVNNRYLDVSVRCPRSCAFAEDRLKKLAGEYTSRGKLDIYVTLERTEGSGCEIKYDKTLLESYLNALRSIQREYSLSDDISISAVAQYREIFTQTKQQEDDDLLGEALAETAREALSDYDAMRTQEGERLRLDIETKLDVIEAGRGKIQELAPNAAENYRNKLTQKITELLGAAQPDPARILTEAAIFAERVATDEEITRLASHINQFKDIMKSKVPVGKKLDFLTQELNREVNTIGSKANDLEISKIVLDLKGEIEKIREQIQNVE